MSSDFLAKLGAGLKAERKKAGLTQTAVGLALGLKPPGGHGYVSCLETGKMGNVGIETVIRYLQICKAPIGRFMLELAQSGASVTPGPWGGNDLLVNCGGYAPQYMDSLVRRFHFNNNTWDRYHFLPSWTSPSQCTAYCAAGSGLCFVPAGLTSGYLYLMTAGAQRPDFWSLPVSADEGGGQANPLGPLPLPIRVVYEPDRIRISFSAVKPTPVCARIYDATGRLVSRLEGSRAVNGEQVFAWDETGSSGGRVERGAYFFTLSLNSGPVRLKFVVR